MIHELEYGIVTTCTSKSDVDWDDLIPNCESKKCKPRARADYLINWLNCDCYKGREAFQCAPCTNRKRVCAKCGAEGFHNIIATI